MLCNRLDSQYIIIVHGVTEWKNGQKMDTGKIVWVKNKFGLSSAKIESMRGKELDAFVDTMVNEEIYAIEHDTPDVNTVSRIVDIVCDIA